MAWSVARPSPLLVKQTRRRHDPYADRAELKLVRRNMGLAHKKSRLAISIVSGAKIQTWTKGHPYRSEKQSLPTWHGE